MQKKIITICASAAHYKQALEIEDQLKKLGFQVVVPKTARIMQKTNNFDALQFKTWYANAADYKKKTALIKAHFKKILEADAILVTNFPKNGLDGYIGGNVLMEMTIAFHFKKPIFIYNPIADTLPIKEEIYGMQPFFIDGKLQLIQKKLK